MTNLADLLPAGGGQNNTEFVADGNISAGAPVILTSDGKAAVITGDAGSVGTSVVFESATSNHMAATYDSANNKIVICYRDDGNSYYGTAVVATVSGDSISFGTPAVFSSSSTMRIAPVFDTYRNRVVIIYKNDGDGSKPYGITGAVSGTSISFGTANLISGNSCDSVSACFDSGNNQTIFSYARASTSGQTGAATVDVSGNIGYGATATFVSNDCSYTQTVFDPDSGKAVVFFTDAGDSYKGKARVITNSSGSISFGTVATMDSSAFFLNTGVDYDTSADKMVIAFADQNTSNYGFALVGTVSGTDITFGTITQFVAGNMSAGTGEGVPVIYDSSVNKSIVAFKNATDGDIGQFTELTVSGTSVTGGSATTFQSGSGVTFVSGAYDANANKTVLAYTNVANSSYGTGVVITPNTSTLSGTNLLGLAPEAISDTATGTINTWGSRCENNDFFGTVTPTYGTPTDAISAFQSESKVLAYDSANNRFVMAYKDGSNSDYGTAVVGELSGTSITWGTPVVFNSATTGSEGLALAFDSNVNRMVIAYQDQGNSSYGTAIVGSVSGTGSGSTIAFGAESVFLSSSTSYIGMEFDSNDNRIVIIYADVANATYTYRVEYVIGTVTTGPDAISFNTPAPINGNSGTYEPVGVCFDASENKILAAYTDNSYDLYVVNLAVSSGSGTPGTASSYSVGQERWPRAVYDSVNSKCGVSWATNTGVWPISFSVISMSGSSVTINTPVQAGATSDSNPFMHNMAFDSSVGQIAICTRSGSSAKGIAYYGSISGTTSSWATESLFADETINAYGVDVAYDTSANKLAFVYTDNTSGTDSLVATLAATTLTIGTDYYVQEDGTLSTTSTSPAQLIGNAIKTNQINIKDYTG